MTRTWQQNLADAIEFFDLLDLVAQLDSELQEEEYIEPEWVEAGYSSSMEVWQAEGR